MKAKKSGKKKAVFLVGLLILSIAWLARLSQAYQLINAGLGLWGAIITLVIIALLLICYVIDFDLREPLQPVYHLVRAWRKKQ